MKQNNDTSGQTGLARDMRCGGYTRAAQALQAGNNALTPQKHQKSLQKEGKAISPLGHLSTKKKVPRRVSWHHCSLQTRDYGLAQCAKGGEESRTGCRIPKARRKSVTPISLSWGIVPSHKQQSALLHQEGGVRTTTVWDCLGILEWRVVDIRATGVGGGATIANKASSNKESVPNHIQRTAHGRKTKKWHRLILSGQKLQKQCLLFGQRAVCVRGRRLPR